MKIRVLLLLLAAAVISYQWRISWNTIHVEMYWDFYVPAVFEPFTKRISASANVSAEEIGKEYRRLESPRELRRGGEVVSIDGQPFRGLSRYLRQLWYVLHRPESEPYAPFTLTVHSESGADRQLVVTFPHCSCGVPSWFEAISTWLLPPLFCISLGFAVALMRPAFPLAWMFLVLMLSLSQLQFWPEEYTGFQQTMTPMLWANPWQRITGVGYRELMQRIWPATLVFASAYFCRQTKRAYRIAIAIAGTFLAYAFLRTALAIAWSENYASWVGAYRVLARHQTGLILLSFAAVAILAWFADRKIGAVITAISVVVGSLFFLPAPAITTGVWWTFSDQTSRYDPTVPAIYNTPELWDPLESTCRHASLSIL